MRIVVIGAGATGGYFGAKLARAGENVSFLARGEHLAAIRERGLTIRSAAEGEWNVRVRALDRLAGEPAVDIVLFCVKSFDTEEAAAMARAVVGPTTAVLSLQNGVDSQDKLARIFGRARVMGGIAYVFATIAEPGVIAHHQLGRLVFGEMDGTVSLRARTFAEACKKAAIPAELTTTITRALWQKYVALAPIAGTTALTRLPVKFIQEVAETRLLWRLQTEEMLALAAAERAGLGGAAMRDCESFLQSLAPANTSSLAQDLAQGKRLEIEALHGHAVGLGRRHQVPTPMLFAVYAALKPYAHCRPAIA